MLERKRNKEQNKNFENFENFENMLVQNFRKAMHTPHMYRVGGSKMHVQSKLLVGIICLLLCFIIFIYMSPSITTDLCRSFSSSSDICNVPKSAYAYNRIYPLTEPKKMSIGVDYRIAIVSDLDEKSKSSTKENLWISYIKHGTLRWMPNKNLITVFWDDKLITLSSSLAAKGRGMELSELVVFDGKLLSVEDRTGIVYRINENTTIPWIILNNGDGKKPKGFKSEWATVKDNYLYVGSMGKEWTTDDGMFISNDPMWIKKVSPIGEIQSIDWTENYKKIRKAYDIDFPGYMIHESAMWSPVHKSWFFLPRRCSKNRYNSNTDEIMSCNIMIKTDETFTDIKITEVGTLIKLRGFSSFKFLPGSNDSIIVALKTEEYMQQTATYITAFHIDGTVLMPELKVIDKKFEGLEFV